MKKISILFILFLLLNSHSFAQTFDKVKMDNYFTTLDTANKFMGSIAISKEGKIIYTRAIGYADMSSKQKANDSSKYRIGSITKTFTAVLVMKAIEAGKIKLDQTIESYFPTIKNAAKITIKQLLGHRSGIHNFTSDSAYLTYNTKPKKENEIIDIISKGGSDFEPGSKADYSNSNFVLLTIILEKSFRKPYAQLLNQYILKPLNLTNTHFGGSTNLANNETHSYSYKDGWQKESETDLSIPLGAGAIVSTPSDLIHFSDALFGRKIVSSQSLKLMTTTTDDYGLGLFPIPFYTMTGYGHNGGIDGFRSVLVHYNEGPVSYAMASNASDFDINNITIAMLSAVYNKPYDMPAVNEYEVAPSDLDLYTGVYSSAALPIKLTVTKKGEGLTAQGTGQAAFPLEATAKHKFRFDQAGIKMIFDPAKKTMVLQQGGGEYEFTRE